MRLRLLARLLAGGDRIVPLFAVLLIALSHLVDEQRLLDTVASNLDLLIPGQADAVTAQVANFLAQRQVVGIVGISSPTRSSCCWALASSS